MNNFLIIEKSAQKSTGLSLEQIKSFSPAELRSHLEKRNHRLFSFISEFPFIGRGNVLRDSLMNSDKLNSDIDKILK